MFGIDDAIMLGGAALSLGAGLSGANAAKKKAGAEQAIFQYQFQADQQRRQAMELNAKRTSLQTLRNAQQAKAVGLAAGVNQGAQFGSGVAGAQSAATTAGGLNILGISQNRQIGENLFDINQNIGAARLTASQAESQMAEDQAWSSLGTGIMKMAGPLGRLSSGIPSLFQSDNS